MTLTVLGNIGIGLVWGWLLGSLYGRVRWPLPTGLAAAASTLLLGLPVLWFTDWRGVIVCAASILCAALAHVLWRRAIRSHSLVSRSRGGRP
jgi:hypothetical protein